MFLSNTLFFINRLFVFLLSKLCSNFRILAITCNWYETKKINKIFNVHTSIRINRNQKLAFTHGFLSNKVLQYATDLSERFSTHFPAGLPFNLKFKKNRLFIFFFIFYILLVNYYQSIQLKSIMGECFYDQLK